jgi:hypothetical protein
MWMDFSLYSMIIGLSCLICIDQQHFTVTGQKCLARIVKSHLNPKLGLRPYEEYHSFSGSKHVHHGRHIHNDQNRNKYGSPMRNDRNEQPSTTSPWTDNTVITHTSIFYWINIRRIKIKWKIFLYSLTRIDKQIRCHRYWQIMKTF